MADGGALGGGGGGAGLVLSGGGARGAYQVGVISALADAIKGPLPFAVITGVSVGAINAAVLAEQADDFRTGARKLERLWRSMRCEEVFHAGPVRLLGRLMRWSIALPLGFAGVRPPRSLLDASPLEGLLTREIDPGRIAHMIESRVLSAFAVTASSYATGNSVTFFQQAEPMSRWSRARRLGEAATIGIPHILASAALPGVFQARQIAGSWYGDGALRQTAPLSPAIHLGCDRLFLIAARDGTPETENEVIVDAERYPSIGVLGGQLLDIVFNDNLDADRERLERINATLDAMIPERRQLTALRPVQTLMVRPSADVRTIAGQHLAEIPLAVKFVLAAIGGLRAPYVLPSYLTFEAGYIGSLIDLGRRDAEAQLPDLLRFIGVNA